VSAESRPPYVAPRDEREDGMATLWSEVLKVDRIGIHDGFFGLGCHSLLATQLAARIRSRFGVELPLSQLFESPTVAGLSAALTRPAWPTLVAIQSGGSRPPLFCVSIPNVNALGYRSLA